MSNQTDQTQAPVAIIGFGVAGFNAAVGLRMSGYDGPINVFSDIETRPYSPILTSYYAGGEMDYEECFPWSEAEIAELDLTVHNGEPVLVLDVAGHLVRTEKGEYPYSKCVIATGSVPTSVGFPADCGYEPIMLRTMEDAQALKDVISSPDCTRILVSGTSMVSLKALEACLNHGLEVTLVGIMPHVLDMNAVPEAAARFERCLEEKGVKIRLEDPIGVVEVHEDEEHPLKVIFRSGDEDSFDAIFVAHGMRNNLGFIEEGSIEVDRGVIVDEFMRSSDPDVYAAGDVVQATELISGEKRIVGIWRNATKQGQCAGRVIAAELAGREVPASCALAGSISMNTITVAGSLFISAGTIQMTDDRYIELEEDDKMIVVRIWESVPDGDRRLVGFNITCDVDEPGGDAYDLGAMLTMHIMRGCHRHMRGA